MEWRSYESLRRIKEADCKYYREQPFRHEKVIKTKNRRFTRWSGSHIGAMGRKKWLIIAFASRFLKSHEMKYSTNELELLGMVWATEHFKNYLYGAEFEVVTDHRALLSALNTNHSNKTMHSRLTPWVNRLLPINFKIRHIPGKEMGITALLSRLP